MDYEVFLREFYRLERFGIKLGLDVITDLLRRLGDPHDRFPAVHVTGTNGKGSVCAYLASILRAAGFRVGLYTSPHLVRFNERIRVNGEMIGDQDVMRLYGEIQPHMEAMAARNPVHHATFFEVTTAMAFQYFAEQEVDIAVIEVGMGGRYDATNVIDPEVSVITRVGLEHTEHLGRTVRRIAREKAGIIKNGKPAVTVEQEALPEIEARCRITGSPLAVVGRDVRFERVRFDLGGQTIRVENGGSREIEVSLLGRFQGENAAVAYAAVLSLRSRGWKVDDFAMLSGFRAARWPGRLEIVRRDPTVIVDGAHNPDAAAALMESLAELVPGKVTLVMGVLVDKDIDLMAAQLVPRVSKMIAVRPKTERALPPEKVSAAFTAAALRMGIPAPPATIIPDAKEAVAAALRDAARADVVLVAGSIYVAGEALEALAHGP